MSKFFIPEITISKATGDQHDVLVTVEVPTNYSVDELTPSAAVTEDFTPQPEGIAVDLAVAMFNNTPGAEDSDRSRFEIRSMAISANSGDVVRVNSWVSNEAAASDRSKGSSETEIGA